MVVVVIDKSLNFYQRKYKFKGKSRNKEAIVSVINHFHRTSIKVKETGQKETIIGQEKINLSQRPFKEGKVH